MKISRKMNKRAEVEIQFHWVFVIVAGFVILGFFLFLVMKQKGISEVKISSSIASDLKAIFTGAQVSSRTLNVVKIPATKISFTCEKNQNVVYSVFTIGKRSEPIPSQVIFSPGEIETLKLYTWSYEWQVPFKVLNFLYLSTPRHRIILVEKKSIEGKRLCNFLNSTLPDQMSKVYISDIAQTPLTQLPDQNNNVETIVFCDFTSQEITNSISYYPAQVETDTLVAISIKGDEKFGNIVFHQDGKDKFINPSQPIKYAGAALLLGAIFSDNSLFYECNREKAIGRLRQVALIYEEKTKQLAQNARAECIYSDSYTHFSKLKTTNDPAEITQSASALSRINSELQSKSCALIY